MAEPADSRAEYDAIEDPYCYKGTQVLKNIPDLRDPAALERFEAVAAAQRSDEPLPSGKFSISHYRAIHHHLFQDVYPWAGRLRQIRLSKAKSTFCYPENIAAELRKLFAELKRRSNLRGLTPDVFAAQAAHFLAELNAIHPFREGNGRSQMTFLTHLAAAAGYPFDLQRLDPPAFLAAMISSFGGDEAPLRQQIRSLML